MVRADRPSNQSRAMVILSMVIFGTLAPFVRRISVSSGELALYRAVMAAVLILVYLMASGQKFRYSEIRKELLPLLVSGIAMGFNWILLFEAYRYTTVSVATLSYYFAPVLVTIVSPVLFREKLRCRQILCFAASTVGLVLVIGVSGGGQGNTELIGILFGLGAAVLYAAVVILNKLIQGVGGIQRTALQFLAAIAVLLPYVVCTGGFSLVELDGAGWLCLAAVGVLHTGVAYCLYFSALKNLPGQEAAILSYVDPLVAVLISVLVLGEGLAPAQAVGGALILGFTLWNELPHCAQKQ